MLLLLVIVPIARVLWSLQVIIIQIGSLCMTAGFALWRFTNSTTTTAAAATLDKSNLDVADVLVIIMSFERTIVQHQQQLLVFIIEELSNDIINKLQPVNKRRLFISCVIYIVIRLHKQASVRDCAIVNMWMCLSAVSVVSVCLPGGR